MTAKPMLRVYPNAFTHVDASGRVNGHLQYEPQRVDPGLRWLGCTCVATLLKNGDAVDKDTFHPFGVTEEHDHCWEYSTEPTLVPLTAYYLSHIQHHDLFPADVETHNYAFGNREGFIDPRVRLAQLATERDCIPRLQGSKSVDPSLTPDQQVKSLEDEWEAFVGPSVAADKAAKKTRDEAMRAAAASAKTTSPRTAVAKSES